MREISTEQLAEILKQHKIWLADNSKGQKADFTEDDLRWANLRGADLRWADLRGVDLRGADVDYSSWPLWCKSLTVIVDERIKRQLLYHVLAIAPEYRTPELLEEANKFHRVPEVPILTMPESE